jgi:hypothetical protein
MATVFDPPGTDIYVIGYVWAKGNASGGQTEVFLSLDACQRRLAALFSPNADRTVKNNEVIVYGLHGTPEWEEIPVSLPTPLQLG